MIIWVRADVPDVIVHLDKAENNPSGNKEEMEDRSVMHTVASADHKNMELADDEMDWHKEVKTVHDNELDTDCRYDVNIGVKCTDHGQIVLHTLGEFQQTWNGRLSPNDMAKDCVKLTTPDMGPISTAPYHARPIALELEMT